MKRFSLLLFALLLTLTLSHCTSARQKRIERNPALFEQLTPEQRQEVLQGKITLAMSKEAVFLAWGRADRATSAQYQGKTIERWSYTGQQTIPIMRPAYVYDVYGFMHPEVFHDTVYIPYEAKWVEFDANRVSAWSAP